MVTTQERKKGKDEEQLDYYGVNEWEEEQFIKGIQM